MNSIHMMRMTKPKKKVKQKRPKTVAMEITLRNKRNLG